MNNNLSNGKPRWNIVGKKYSNFTDLGNYVIEVDPYETIDFDAAWDYINNRYDARNMACTACATKNDEGEVLIGRNMDITISQCPCYISHTSFGKYSTVNFTYSAYGEYKYDELVEKGEIDYGYLNAIPYLATDAMNSEGLYMEVNLREPNEYYNNSGTNPGKLRVWSMALCALVVENCKTVKEAVEYLKNELDIYTMGSNDKVDSLNSAYMIGDATGEFGLIEIARNEVSYLPYQYGQANYYQTPKWNVVEVNGSGYGRLAILNKGLNLIKDEYEMLNHVKKAMWRNELLYVDSAYRDEEGFIHFVNDKGEEVPDWRSDFSNSIPLDENMNILEKTGHELGYFKYLVYDDESCKEDFLKHKECLNRSIAQWICDDARFEETQKFIFKMLTENGSIEKLKQFYEGNEKPLREGGEIWTTSFSFGVNCKKKHLILKIWERDDLIYDYQW